jgi:hypothetical protein
MLDRASIVGYLRLAFGLARAFYAAGHRLGSRY